MQENSLPYHFIHNPVLVKDYRKKIQESSSSNDILDASLHDLLSDKALKRINAATSPVQISTPDATLPEKDRKNVKLSFADDISEESSYEDSDQKDAEEDLIGRIVGDFGKWQFIIGVLMALIKLPVAWYQLNIIFLAPPQDYWCTKPKQLSMLTEREWRRMSTPIFEEHACLIFDPDILAIFPTMDKRMLPLVECKNFTFSHRIFRRTIISEWNLVCSRHWFVHFCQVELMWGVLVGGILFGVMADKQGRKISLMTSIVLESITGVLSGLIPWFWLFLVNRFLLALATGGIAIVSFVISMEVVSGKWRTIIPVICQLPFGIGNTVMAGIAYWLRDWRKLELGLGCITSLFCLCWFYVPESPRWLMATGQTEKAVEALKHAAKINNRPFSDDDIKKVLGTKLKSASIKNVPRFSTFIKLKNMRTRTILLSTNWFITGLSYYTFAQYLGYIGNNIFITVAVSGMIATPGGILCIYVVLKQGRKSTIAGFQLLTALCFVCLLFMPRGVYSHDWPRLMFAGLGMAGMAGAVPALYLISAELYPTIGRNAGVGGVTLFARMGSMIAPLLVGLDEIKVDFTILLLAILSFAQILLIMPLPETQNCPLPATMQEAENFGTKEDPGFPCIKPIRKTRANKIPQGNQDNVTGIHCI